MPELTGNNGGVCCTTKPTFTSSEQVIKNVAHKWISAVAVWIYRHAQGIPRLQTGPVMSTLSMSSSSETTLQSSSRAHNSTSANKMDTKQRVQRGMNKSVTWQTHSTIYNRPIPCSTDLLPRSLLRTLAVNAGW